MATNKAVIILGACGALGRAVVKRFKTPGWTPIGLDIAASDSALHSVVIKVINLTCFITQFDSKKHFLHN